MNKDMEMSGKVAELAETMMKEKDESKTEKENLILAYEKRMPVASGEEAVRDILKGDADFESAMEGNTVEPSEAQGQVSIGQQYNRAVGLINHVIQIVNDNPQYGMEPQELISEKAEDEVTAEDLKEIKDLLAETGEKFGPLMLENEEMASALSALDTDELGELNEDRLDEEYKHYLELAAFILHQQGELAGAVPPETDAYSFGATIAAAVAVAKAKVKALMGKIPWEKVLNVLSKVGKALLTVVVAGGAAALVVSLLGVGTIVAFSRIVLVIAIVVCAKKAIDWIRSDEAKIWFKNVKEKAKDMTQKVGSWLWTFWSWIKEKAVALWQKFSEKIQNLSVKNRAQEETEVDEGELTEEEEDEEIWEEDETEPAFV